jgi:hypothetical protein
MFLSSLPLAMETIIERGKWEWEVKEKQIVVVGDWKCMVLYIYLQSTYKNAKKHSFQQLKVLGIISY